MKTYKPKTINEAIDDLQTFFQVDMYSKFRPEHKLPTGKNKKMESWYRQDWFKSEKDFIEYLEAHFNVLKKEINRLRRKNDKES
jgi:hypothetical protein